MQTAMNPLCTGSNDPVTHSYSALTESLKIGIIRRQSGALKGY